jgi:hypothetical protein
MKNLLSKYLNKPQDFQEAEQTPSTKNTKKVKSKDGLIEVVEKTILVEDGRQILTD